MASIIGLRIYVSLSLIDEHFTKLPKNFIRNLVIIIPFDRKYLTKNQICHETLCIPKNIKEKCELLQVKNSSTDVSSPTHPVLGYSNST